MFLKGVEVLLYTKKGGPNVVVEINPGAKQFKASAYYRPKEFYTHKYDKLGKNDKPDFRRTVHWEPIIETDNDGKATITFYNTDRV